MAAAPARSPAASRLVNSAMSVFRTAGSSRSGSLPCATSLGELAPHRVKQLLQGVAGAVDRALGPEAGDHLVAGHAPLARRGQEGQQREAAPLRGHVVAGSVGQGQPAEGLEPEHERKMSAM